MQQGVNRDPMFAVGGSAAKAALASTRATDAAVPPSERSSAASRSANPAETGS